MHHGPQQVYAQVVHHNFSVTVFAADGFQYRNSLPKVLIHELTCRLFS